MLKHAGHAAPWPFWRLRDIRTMEGLGLAFVGDDPVLDAKESAWLPEELCAEHVAVFDALLEARELYSTIRALTALSTTVA